MIVPSEIVENDIVKVLVSEEDVEDEMYGIVGMNTGLVLGIRYLELTNKTYKSACVYAHDPESDMSPVPYESLMEHHPSGVTFEDLEMKSLGDNMYAKYDEIDIEDDDSEIYDEESDSETDSEMNDFIVADDHIDGIVLPPGNHIEIDKEWNEWKPSTPGARSFKETVDIIEMHARQHADNLNF
jgi:hypothetical protein